MKERMFSIVESPKRRIIFATLVTFVAIAAVGAYATIRDYYGYKDLKGLGGPPKVWAFRFYVYWLFLALALSIGVLACQSAYEWLLARRKIVGTVALTLALPIIMALFSYLAYLPDFGWFFGPPEPGPLQRWIILLGTYPVLLATNLLRYAGKSYEVA